jgi:Asp/Glu/hydantoin racemase
MRILFMLPGAKGVYPEEAAERRITLLKSYSTPGLEIDVDYMPEPSGFLPFGGFSAPDNFDSERVARTHDIGARRALQAEQEGYGGFCPFGAVDVGVAEARRRGLRIPAFGPGEASALLCAMIGRPFATCSYVAPRAGPSRYAAFGIEHLHVFATAIGFDNNQYPERHDEVLEILKERAREARERGAELFGGFGQSVCPTEFSAEQIYEATGMPAIDGVAAQISMVQTWQRTGLPSSLLRSLQ